MDVFFFLSEEESQNFHQSLQRYFDSLKLKSCSPPWALHTLSPSLPGRLHKHYGFQLSERERGKKKNSSKSLTSLGVVSLRPSEQRWTVSVSYRLYSDPKSRDTLAVMQ